MLYVRHAGPIRHEPGQWLADHPDSPERIAAIESALREQEWCGCGLRHPPDASEDELLLVHSPALVRAVAELCAAGGGRVDDDTFVVEDSYREAVAAAGGACAMVRALIGGEVATAFSGMRPAGHHASRDRAMGFCLFNNVAIAAELAIRELGVERVLIVDWDVHHGNGTAEIFRRRSDVLFASIHQAGLYPGTGAITDAGSAAGYGYTINVPVPPRSGEEVWLSVLEHLIVPAAVEFAPQLILISAGFDAHRADPLGDCLLEASSFAQMACQLRDLGAQLGAPVGAVLEGGYDPPALAESVLATVAALGGAGMAESAAPDQIVTPRAAAHSATTGSYDRHDRVHVPAGS